MMNIIEIDVPEGIEYISQWENFTLPEGHCIVDKTVCGCGFTEFCLTYAKASVIAAPRRSLLDNKFEQHKNDSGLYYFKNEIDDEICAKYDIDSKAKTILGKIPKEKRQAYLAELKTQLYDWLKDTLGRGIIPKILVTYDSLHHVLDVLKSLSLEFPVIVDEFQSIFLDASFKSEVEFEFVESLKSCKDVLYLSATPMLEKYLESLDYFKDLPFYKLNWGLERVENVRIERKIVRSIPTAVKEIIEDYRAGIYPRKVLKDRTLFESRELVVFVNSIKSITDIIGKCKLSKDEVNILCADTPENIKKLESAGLELGRIPLKGEEHKMFTFCTRTTYLGADFYSTNAYSVICSDCSVKSLALDISLDLPQIIGRQRLKENAFRNEVLFLYRAANSREATLNLSEEEYNKMIDQQDAATMRLLRGYQEMSDENKLDWVGKALRDKELYANDFLSVSKKTGEPVYNYLVKISKQRAYDVTRKEYQDSVTIKKSIENIQNLNIQVTDERVFNEFNSAAESLVRVFEATEDFPTRMQSFCRALVQYPQLVDHSMVSTLIPLKFFNYYNILGFELIRSVSYREKDIIEIFEKKMNEGNTNLAESGLFVIGERYTKAEIKEKIKTYYDENNIVKTAKASDLEEFYELKPCLILNSNNGKRDNGFIIIRRKE